MTYPMLPTNPLFVTGSSNHLPSGTEYPFAGHWANLPSASVKDGNDATQALSSGTSLFTSNDELAQLTYLGLRVGTNRGFIEGTNIQTPPNQRWMMFGSTGTNDWGYPLTPDIVNDPTFGFVWAGNASLNIGPPTYITDYLVATNFDFGLPPTAQINALRAEIWRYYSGVTMHVDSVRMIIYYTFPKYMQGVISGVAIQTVTF